MLINQLNEIISERHLLKHMYYQAWSNGELTRDMLRDYSIDHAKLVEEFPKILTRIHTYCPEMAARKVLTENLADEEIHGKDHLTLWMQFAEGMGATDAHVKAHTILPETRKMIDTFYALAERDWRDGLCALYAYEYQVPEVAASKIAGLKQFYGIHDERTLEFFTAHQQYDVEHSQQVATLIEQFVEPERAARATKEAADALWGFLDGMSRISGIQC